MINLNWKPIGEHICQVIWDASNDIADPFYTCGLKSIDLEGKPYRVVSDVEEDALVPHVTVQFGQFNGRPSEGGQREAFMQDIQWHIFLMMKLESTTDSASIYLENFQNLANVLVQEHSGHGRAGCDPPIKWTTALRDATNLWPDNAYPEEATIFDPEEEDTVTTKRRCLHWGFINFRTVFTAWP